MMHREIDQAIAAQIEWIVREECCRFGGGLFDNFVSKFITAGKDPFEICNEWRFCGALGFGGKIRNNGNNDNVPYVDCYREDETPQRLAMIERANKRIAGLFFSPTRPVYQAPDTDPLAR